MSVNDFLDLKDWDTRCIVCGKSVEGGGGMCHVRYENRMVALCCPLCIETFNKDPKHYLALQEIQQIRPPGPLANPEQQ